MLPCFSKTLAGLFPMALSFARTPMLVNEMIDA